MTGTHPFFRLLKKRSIGLLPPALRQACDLSTLRLESGSFVEDDLRAHYSDVLYSLKTGQGDGYIYALIEHQCKRQYGSNVTLTNSAQPVLLGIAYPPMMNQAKSTTAATMMATGNRYPIFMFFSLSGGTFRPKHDANAHQLIMFGRCH